MITYLEMKEPNTETVLGPIKQQVTLNYGNLAKQFGYGTRDDVTKQSNDDAARGRYIGTAAALALPREPRGRRQLDLPSQRG